MKKKFMKLNQEGLLKEIEGCPIHGKDKDKIIGRVSDTIGCFLRDENRRIIRVATVNKVPPHNCNCDEDFKLALEDVITEKQAKKLSKALQEYDLEKEEIK